MVFEDDGENDVLVILFLCIIFVCFGKDKLKDVIEDEIFKCIGKVLEEYSDIEIVLEEFKNCIMLLVFVGC